jgi:hypothetical protein
VLNDWNFNLKQRFNIKCTIDVTVFIIILAIFASFSLKHGITASESLLCLTIIFEIGW